MITTDKLIRKKLPIDADLLESSLDYALRELYVLINQDVEMKIVTLSIGLENLKLTFKQLKEMKTVTLSIGLENLELMFKQLKDIYKKVNIVLDRKKDDNWSVFTIIDGVRYEIYSEGA